MTGRGSSRKRENVFETELRAFNKTQEAGMEEHAGVTDD